MGYSGLFAALDGSLQGWHPQLVVSPRLEALESGNFSTTSPTSLHVFWRHFFLLGASSGDGKKCWHVASDEAPMIFIMTSMQWTNAIFISWCFIKRTPRSPDTWTAGRSFHLEVATPGQIFKAWRDVVRWFGPGHGIRMRPLLLFFLLPFFGTAWLGRHKDSQRQLKLGQQNFRSGFMCLDLMDSQLWTFWTYRLWNSGRH